MKNISSQARFLVYVGLLFIVVQHNVFAQNGSRKNDHTAKIQAMLAQAHKYRLFNGSALVAENGKVIYKGGFGMANMEWGIPNAPDTKFRLGSITKQFTSMLILQLVEQGKVRLDAKISDYLPDYRKDIGEKVTVHQLLTHTSGIPSYTGLPNFFQDVSRNPYKVDDFVKKYASGDLEFEPGSKFLYNNSGYFLLGAIIEHVTGKSYEKALQERIFDPVGMKNTGYDHHDTLIQKRAAGYAKTPDGYTNAPYLDMSIPYAAGSLYSTVEDLFLWDQALYTNSLLSEQSKNLMYKPFLQDYAYGWVVRNAAFKENNQPVQVIAHGGGINGFATNISRYPNQKNLIVILDNTGQATSGLAETIGKILYNQPYEMPKMPLVAKLDKTIREKGLEAGIAEYRELKAKQSDMYDFSESQLNELGYLLLRTGKRQEAVEIFKLNVEAYPKGFNTYDSLAEAYAATDQRELAIANYKKSLELNPENKSAVDGLKTLEQPPVKVDRKILETYVGDYELRPGFVMKVFLEGDRLFTQATGQNKFEVFPESETTFSPREFKAKMTFVKDPDGKINGIKLNQNGREIFARRLL
jgi:CubicO group peptidase (beta-lactamase class C family)